MLQNVQFMTGVKTMSKLEQLIAELCPDGVEYRSIGSLITRIRDRGKNNFDVQQVYAVSNSIGMVKAEEFRENAIHSEDTSNYSVIRPNMFAYNPSRLNIGSIARLKDNEPGLVSPMYVVFSIDETVLLKEYFEYNISSSYVKNKIDSLKEEGARFRFDFARWDLITIPVPPLPVQSEIVRILDNFTELISELTAELTARKKQYEYYRRELLTFSDDVLKMRLGDTCDMKAGKAIKSELISVAQSDNTNYECFGGNGVRGYVSEPNQHGNFPIIGRQGALCGNVNYATGDFYATEHAVVVKSKGAYTHRFLFYLLKDMNLNQYKSQGAQPGLAVKNIEELLAWVPSIARQNQVVELLDHFDTLCNDISTGLPAEIEARKKQYEYYRDKLLTFKELS